MDLTTTKKYPGGTLTITKHPAHGTERHQHSIGDARAAAAASRPATAVPEGWMSVQVVEDVRAVVDGAMTGYCPYHTSARSSMRRLAAMLSAAPQPATVQSTCSAHCAATGECTNACAPIDPQPEAQAGADDRFRDAIAEASKRWPDAAPAILFLLESAGPTLPITDDDLAWARSEIAGEPQPKPAEGGAVEMSPEFTDTARGAIAWVLYHHQGGSSAIGKPLRYALGLGAHEDMPTHLIQQAKHYASAAGRSTADFHAPAAATRAEEVANIDAIDHAVKMLEDVHGDRVTAGSLRRVARRLAGKGE